MRMLYYISLSENHYDNENNKINKKKVKKRYKNNDN